MAWSTSSSPLRAAEAILAPQGIYGFWPANAEAIGIALSDESQLHPEQSTSAIVLHHPQAKYFSV